MPIVSMSVNQQILQKFDAILKKKGYSTRSEAFREALRNFIDEGEWVTEEGTNEIVVTIIYDEHKIDRGALSLIQHKYKEIIHTLIHNHLEDINCLEVFIANGSSEELKAMLHDVRKIKGIKQLKFVTTATGV